MKNGMEATEQTRSGLSSFRICRAAHSAAWYPEEVAAAVLTELEGTLARELRVGLSLAEFEQLVARGASWESLLPGAALDPERLARCREALFLRYRIQLETRQSEGAERSFRLLQRLFPDAPASFVLRGRLAMLRGDATTAQKHFERGLALAPGLLGALSGLADLAAAAGELQASATLRLQAIAAAEALPVDDPDRTCQGLRYGLLLCELALYGPARAVLREAVRGSSGLRGATTQERERLCAVLSSRLYSPAAISELLVNSSAATLPPQAAAARDSAIQLARAYRFLFERPACARRALLLGLCAWEAGDPECAYLHADDADETDDPLAHYLLLVSAEVCASAELNSIKNFALAAAERVLCGNDASPDDHLCAALITLRSPDRQAAARAMLERADTPLARWLLQALQSDTTLAAADPPAALSAQLASSQPDLETLLEQLALWRGALRTAGLSRQHVARLSATVHPHCARASMPNEREGAQAAAPLPEYASSLPSWVVAALRLDRRS